MEWHPTGPREWLYEFWRRRNALRILPDVRWHQSRSWRRRRLHEERHRPPERMPPEKAYHPTHGGAKRMSNPSNPKPKKFTPAQERELEGAEKLQDRKSTRLNSSHL